MDYATLTVLVLALPLTTSIFLGLWGKRLKPLLAGIVGTSSTLLATIFSIVVAWKYFFLGMSANGGYEKITALSFEWLKFNSNLSIDMGILLDPISVMMLLVITFISLMVHIYSLQYMKGEERFQSYYAYLSLFTMAMLGVVVSTNIFEMYIFWELVGVSSFLLIGFYFNKPSAIAAAKKAFIVTRFADLGFLIGILILGFGAQTFNFSLLIERLTDPSSANLTGMLGTGFLGVSAVTWGVMLVFMGGAGKSAMFPLHIWLPDAMEGPTPVSALIHAATMVVAGVYLVARLFPVFAISAPEALPIVAYIAAFTALFSAIIATTQTDIKRVLAFSTISQIGYMMLALGVAGWGEGQTVGYTASMFHLFTHAFFKGLLFLGAGAIIHAVHSNDMRQMGGLRKNMPITHFAFLAACLAISGIPPFSGFFSKEAILHAAYEGNKPVYYIALFTSGLTAFYMFRLYFNIFWHNQSADKHNHEHGLWAMNIPLILLALGAIFAGFIPFGHFVSATGLPLELHGNLAFSIAPVSLGLAGIVLAALLYARENTAPQKIVTTLGVTYQWVYQKFYVDELYLFITKKVIFNLIGRPAAWFDRHMVDGLMNGSAYVTTKVSESIKVIQSGRLQTYAYFSLGGIIGLIIILVFV